MWTGPRGRPDGGEDKTMADEAVILVVDDDARLRSLLSRYLAENGFRVTTAASAAEAREKLRFLQPELMVLDVMMAGESGLELTESLRRDNSEVPVLLLTARGAPEDRIAGFEAGADDYLPKPFDPKELLLRIRARLRRAVAPPPAPDAAPGPLPLGPLAFDPQRAELTGPEGVVRLTGGEAALLAVLARKPNEVFSREDIVVALSMDETGERAIDVMVTRLRRKLEADPREPRFLHTVRGRGYVLKPGR
jgi:two-component system phosphate regulon response regulator OmpR